MSCLGVTEEEMGEDINEFFRQILGTKNLTGENTTLRDIKETELEGINNLQDLIDTLTCLNDEHVRQEMLEGKTKENGENLGEEIRKVEFSEAIEREPE